MGTRPCTILYISTGLESALLCAKFLHPRVFNIVVTLDVLRKSDMTQRAALRWTRSIWFILVTVCGSQTLAAYYSCGRTTALYAADRSCWCRVGMLRRMKPRELLALLVTLLIWSLQFRLSDISKPRYLADVVVSST